MKSNTKKLSCNERNLVDDNMLGDNTERKSNHQHYNISLPHRMHLLITNAGKAIKQFVRPFVEIETFCGSFLITLRISIKKLICHRTRILYRVGKFSRQSCYPLFFFIFSFSLSRRPQTLLWFFEVTKRKHFIKIILKKLN